MSKFSVKNPFTVLVGVVLVLVLGYVSFTTMTTDLLPEMNLPYLLVITTEPGASPEMVEANVTMPLEGALGTVNGVESVSSSSAENYSIVFLEFGNDINMDSAMVKVSSQLDLLKLPDDCGNPMVIEMSPDMMATMMVTVDYEGKDIFELTRFVNDTVIPELERQEGVANVEASGLAEKYIEVRLNQDKIDDVNWRLLKKVEGTLADSEQELADARRDLEKAKKELEDSEKELSRQQDKTANEMAKFSKMMAVAIATQSAYEANLTTLQANQAALTAERQGYQQGVDQIDAMIREAYKAAEGQIGGMSSADLQILVLNQFLGSITEETKQSIRDVLGEDFVIPEAVSPESEKNIRELWDSLSSVPEVGEILEKAMDAIKGSVAPSMNPLPKDLDDALADNGARLAVLQAMLIENGQAEAAAQLSYETLKSMKDRVSAIDVELSNLNTETMVAEAALEKVKEGVAQALENYEKVEAGKITAAASFGSFSAQMATGKGQIESGLEQLEEAEDAMKDARKTALENANLDALLTMQTLSGILTAENFDMPAGYIKNGEEQYLLKVGEKFDTVDALEGAILTNIEDIGDIHLRDVADIVVLDNVGENYTKVNGNEAIMISITKSSTAGTSSVAKVCNKAMDKMEEKYAGLNFTNMMDQGEYIGVIIDSVLSNLIWGAVLAFIVLLLFMKDLVPTLVVAISIPLSVLFAIVLMYFTGITMNIISLSGLALGVGMLVDNSVVVMENIYRMRGLGVPAARAAVKGSRQVTGAIVASTLTTVCVFLPIVFTSGLARQLFTDMGLTIGFSLSASVVVALTVVPALSATLLKNSREKEHKLFDRMLEVYDRVLRFCLRVKILPLAVALGLLIFCGYQVTRIGLTLIPGMGGTQMSMSITPPEECTKEEAFAFADDFMEMAKDLPGMETVGILDSASAASSLLSGGMGGMGGGSAVQSFTVYLVVDEDTANDTTPIEEAFEEYFDGSEWGYSLSTSNMDISSLLASGMQISIQGKELDTLIGISEDVMGMLEQVEGLTDIGNGQEESDATYKIVVNKDRAMRKSLTVAQVYQTVAGALATDTTSTTLVVGNDEYVIHVVDDRDPVSLDNVLELEMEYTTMNDKGEQEKNTCRLKDICDLVESPGVSSISRADSVRYITVSASAEEGYNVTLLSREVEKLLADYEVPEGYKVKMAGESESVMDTMTDLLKMIALACVFIYLIMVAQFQSLLSPFIVIFTVPLAFTGGLLALLISRQELSMIAMMGFLVLSGVVVNNGIVFVDYANQLRLAGIEKREALVRTGKTRMRPILMTALTTILAMCTMAFDNSFSGSMGKGMATVVIGGLTYATFMTLFIIPVLYDLLFRRELKVVDLGDLDSLADDDVL